MGDLDLDLRDLRPRSSASAAYADGMPGEGDLMARADFCSDRDEAGLGERLALPRPYRISMPSEPWNERAD